VGFAGQLGCSGWEGGRGLSLVVVDFSGHYQEVPVTGKDRVRFRAWEGRLRQGSCLQQDIKHLPNATLVPDPAF
jgi:hypothetical protein